MSEGAIYEYMAQFNIDQLELIRKFNAIEWMLFIKNLPVDEKYKVVQKAVTRLKFHLQMLYITHSINPSRLSKHEQAFYNQLEELMKYSPGLTDEAKRVLILTLASGSVSNEKINDIVG